MGEDHKPVILPVRRKIEGKEVNVQIMPTIEIQYKTFAVKAISETGSASHMIYKGKTIQKIRELKQHGFFGGITIPKMWSTNERGEIYELTDDQVVNKMYPFLNKFGEKGKEEK